MTVPPDRRLIGGADIAAILGISPHATASDVWLRIVEGVAIESNDVMEQGQLMEPGLFALIEAKAPGEYQAHPTLRHPEFKHGVGHLDLLRKSPDRCVVDAKMIHWRVRDRWLEDGETVVPDYVRLQVDWYAQCAKTEKAEVGAFFGLGDFKLLNVEPLDFDTRGSILEAVERFWVDYIETREPPPPDGGRAYSQILTRMFPVDGGAVEFDDAAAATAAELLEVKRQLQELEKKETALKQDVEAWLKGRGAVSASRGKLKASWSLIQKESVSWKSIVEQLDPPPALIAAHTRTSPYTALRITEGKSK